MNASRPEPTSRTCITCRNMGRFHCPRHRHWHTARNEYAPGSHSQAESERQKSDTTGSDGCSPSMLRPDK